jgi:hypothetical protein
MGLGFGIRDPGSGKNLFRIPDPGVKKAPDPGSATLDECILSVLCTLWNVLLSCGKFGEILVDIKKIPLQR